MTSVRRDELATAASDDSRLGGALKILAREAISVLSLDIFDTLVWRTVPEPVDAFILLGQRLRTLECLPAHVSPEMFGRLRAKAESRARANVARQTGSPELSLEIVYEEMHSLLSGRLTVDEMCAVEVDLERDIAHADLDVVHLARLAQDVCGARVILVSDTYYSERQLRRMLDQEPFDGLEFSRIFASSEHKVGKASGLYQVVLDELGVAPTEVLHVGDHPESDVASAAKKGMHTVHFPKMSEELSTVLQREGVVPATGAKERSAVIDADVGDMGLTALRSKATFRSEAGRFPAELSTYSKFGASVLGPPFTGFAEWVHRRAREEGVSTVFCVMREGEFLSRLVNGARHYLGSPVNAEILWLSRQTCARAAIFEANEQELAGFVNRRRHPTLRQFCEDLGIGLAQLPEVFTDAEGRLDQPDLWPRTLEAITSRPDVQTAITTSSSRLRERLVRYFFQTVGADPGRILLADIGWGATIQGHLAKALAGSGVEVDMLGLYMITNESALERALDGVETDGYLAKGGIPEQAVRLIIRSPEIIEQVCMTDVGTLVGFTEEGEPVSGPTSQSPLQTLQRTAVQSGILGFQRHWARYSEVAPHARRPLDERARPWLLETLLRFVVSPTTAEAKMFGTWAHDENFGSEDSEKVIVEDMAPLLKYMTPTQFLSLPMSRVYWPFGLASLHNPPLAREVSAILAGVIPPEAFTAEDQRDVVISLDSLGLLSTVPAPLARRVMTPLSQLFSLVPGFKATRRATILAGGGGRCFVREEIPSQPIRAVRIEFPPGPGVVRLDRLSMTFALRGRPQPVLVHIEWPEQFRDVAYARCVPLAPNLLFGGHRSPQVVYTCPKDWGTDAYNVEVEMAFAWLPTAPAKDGPAARTGALSILGERVGDKVQRLWQASERTQQ